MSNFSRIDARHEVRRDLAEPAETDDLSSYQPLTNSSSSVRDPAYKSTFLTGSLAFAIFIIGIVAAANGWAHGPLSLSAVTAGAALTRFTFRAAKGDMTKKGWAFEILLLIGLIAGAGATFTGNLSTQSLGHLLWSSSVAIFLNFCKSLSSPTDQQEITQRYRASIHKREGI